MKTFTYRGHTCCYNEFRTEGDLKPMILLPDDGCAGYSVQNFISYIPSEYTIVLVTHNMQQAKRISDYTSFFLNGEIVESGRTCDVFSNPTPRALAE